MAERFCINPFAKSFGVQKYRFFVLGKSFSVLFISARYGNKQKSGTLNSGVSLLLSQQHSKCHAEFFRGFERAFITVLQNNPLFTQNPKM